MNASFNFFHNVMSLSSWINNFAIFFVFFCYCFFIFRLFYSCFYIFAIFFSVFPSCIFFVLLDSCSYIFSASSFLSDSSWLLSESRSIRHKRWSILVLSLNRSIAKILHTDTICPTEVRFHIFYFRLILFRIYSEWKAFELS